MFLLFLNQFLFTYKLLILSFIISGEWKIKISNDVDSKFRNVTIRGKIKLDNIL